MTKIDSGFLAIANEGVRFLLEVVALMALGYWGYRTGQGQIVKIGLGLGIPLVIAVIWGLLGAPAAPYRLAQPWRLGLEVIILGSAVVGLYLLDRASLALIFGIIAILNTFLLYFWAQT